MRLANVGFGSGHGPSNLVRVGRAVQYQSPSTNSDVLSAIRSPMAALNLPGINNVRMLAVAASISIGMLAGACTPGASPAPTATEPSRATATKSADSTPEAAPSNSESAPDFTLPAATGGEVSLSGYQGEKPVVLVFYRAFW